MADINDSIEILRRELNDIDNSLKLARGREHESPSLWGERIVQLEKQKLSVIQNLNQLENYKQELKNSEMLKGKAISGINKVKEHNAALKKKEQALEEREKRLRKDEREEKRIQEEEEKLRREEERLQKEEEEDRKEAKKIIENLRGDYKKHSSALRSEKAYLNEVKNIMNNIPRSSAKNINEINSLKRHYEEREKIAKDYEKKLSEIKKESDRKNQNFFQRLGSDIKYAAKEKPKSVFQNTKSKWKNDREDKREQKYNRREELKKETLKDYWARQKDKQDYVKQKWANAKERKEQWKEKLSKTSGSLFIILAVMIHMMKFSLNFGVAATWILDVLLAIVVYLFIFRKEERGANGLRSILIILALEIGLPILLGYNQALASNKFIKYYLLNRLLTPWWLYYATIWANDTAEPGKFPKIVKILIILFWVGVLLTVPAIGFAKVPMAYYADMQQSELAVDYYLKSYNFWFEEVPDILGRGFSSIGDAFDRQMAIATGGYYVGHVDENQDKPLGVFLESVKPAAPDFYYSSPTSVYGILKIASLDDGIKVKVNCYNGYKKDGKFQDSQKATEVYPKEETWMYDMERQDVDCLFNERRLDRGVHRITLTADFNFDTMGYLKTYFMNKDTMRSLIQQGKEPLKEFGVSTEPSAVYTNGPVRIGIGGFGQPIGIESNSAATTSPKIGITIESNTGWKGRIKKLEELKVQIPEGLEIDTSTCNFDFEKATIDTDKCVAGHMKYRTKEFRACQADAGLESDSYFNDDGSFSVDNPPSAEDKTKFNDCLLKSCKQEQEGYTSYYLKTKNYPKEFSDIENYITISCRMKINNPATILGDTPVAIHYLRARARYTYEIEESTQVTIKKSDEEIAADRATSSLTDDQKIGSVSMDYNETVKEVVNLINANGIGDKQLPKNSAGESLLTSCLVNGIITTESGGRPTATSSVGAEGLMQVMPDTAAPEVKAIIADSRYNNLVNKYGLTESSYDGHNPKHSILIGTYYFAQRLINSKEFGRDIPTASGNTDSDFSSSIQETTEYLINQDIIKYALAEYNRGPGGVGRSCKVDGKYILFASCSSKLPEETQNYVPRVLGFKKKCDEKGLDIGITLEDPIRSILDYNYDVKIGYSDDDLKSCLKLLDDPLGPSDLVPIKYKELAIRQAYGEKITDQTDLDMAFLGCIGGEKPRTLSQANEAFLPETRISIMSREISIDDISEPKFLLDLSFNKYPNKYMGEDLGVKLDTLEYSKDNLDDKYGTDFIAFERYPFVRIKMKECKKNIGEIKCSFAVKYVGKLIANSPLLEEDATLVDGETPYYRDIESSTDSDFPDFLEIHYDDDLIIRNKETEQKICVVENWDKYKKEEMCEDIEDNLRGVGIDIKNKDPSLGDGYAEVQIQYDPLYYSPTCCSGSFGRCGEQKSLCLDMSQADSQKAMEMIN